jgi:hypothetical protein
LDNKEKIFPFNTLLSYSESVTKLFSGYFDLISLKRDFDLRDYLNMGRTNINDSITKEDLDSKYNTILKENKKLAEDIKNLSCILDKTDEEKKFLNDTISAMESVIGYSKNEIKEKENLIELRENALKKASDEIRELDKELQAYEEIKRLTLREKANRDMVIDYLQKQRREMDDTINKLLVHKKISEFVNSNLDIKKIIDFTCTKIEESFQIEVILFELYDSDKKKGRILKTSQKPSIDGVLADIDLRLFEGKSFDVDVDLKDLRIIGKLSKDHSVLYKDNEMRHDFHFECIVFNIVSQKELLGRFLVKPYGSIEIFKKKKYEALADIFALITPAVKTSLVLSKMADVNLKLASKEKLISDDLEIAKRLVNSLLKTEYEHIDDLEFFVHYKPLYEIGGDFIDIHKFKNGTVRIFIADAVGHGIQAALITMLIKSHYEKLKNKHSDPSRILSELNTAFCSLDADMLIYFTGIVVDINVSKNKVVFVSAGHPPQLIIKKTGIERLKPKGHIVGYSDDASFPKTIEEISPGDKIVLFTDGLYEEFSKNEEEFGYERFFKLVEDVNDLPVKELGNALVEKVDDWIKGSERFDDMSLVVCQIK